MRPKSLRDYETHLRYIKAGCPFGTAFRLAMLWHAFDTGTTVN